MADENPAQTPVEPEMEGNVQEDTTVANVQEDTTEPIVEEVPAEMAKEEKPPAMEPEKPPPTRTETKGDEASGPCISPTQSGEDLPEGEIQKIITETQEILKFCQTKVDEHKIECHSLAFMLLRIKESLDAYGADFIPKINTFLVQADKITADYYAHMCNTLPKYGDYVKAIEADQSGNIDVGAGAPVGKQQLLDLVRGVTDNYYAGAMFLKTGRNVYKDVNNSQQERKDMVNKINAPMPSWMLIQDNVTSQLECIRDHTFKIAAYIDFLKQGESKTGPSLDLTPLNKKSNSPDSDPKKVKSKREKMPYDHPDRT